jgi:hypothetical protein
MSIAVRITHSGEGSRTYIAPFLNAGAADHTVDDADEPIS